jgi:hypothetical protein
MSTVSDRELHMFLALKTMGNRRETTGAGFGGKSGANGMGRVKVYYWAVDIVWQ